MERSEPILFYRDGRNYDAMHRKLPFTDTPFYIEEAKKARGAVLELACGTGRLTIPIAQSGVEIAGLDQSESMLEHARSKARDAQVNIQWVKGDCRQFDFKRKFALIFMAFHSMQHLHDHASLRALFHCVREHLEPGGCFLFDVFNPSIAILNRDPKQRYVDRQFEDPDGRGTVTLETMAVYEDALQVTHITLYFSLPHEKDFRVEPLHLRCFFPQELELLIRTNGFEIENKYGNFEGKPFANGDPKQIVICKSVD